MPLSSIQSIVVLTGAGVSAESGIKTFRDIDGLWENYRVEEVASPEGFAADPVLVHQFYNMRRHRLLHGGIEPNPAHLALAKLDREFPGEFPAGNPEYRQPARAGRFGSDCCTCTARY